MKINKIRNGLFVLASIVPLPCGLLTTSCGLSQPWDWYSATKENKEINYCLLIGQNEHTESIERTRGTRIALGTYDEVATKKVKDNANIAEPIQGNITLTSTKSGKEQTFVVNEIEHMEQKSITGASWDSIQANATAGTWIAKHGNDITFFVSNNDAMAEGAYWASNWIEGMPIFGYDANSSTLQWINSGQITGTVDQNPSTQAASAMMIFRNMLEDRDTYWWNGFHSEAAHGYGTKEYTPTYRGFRSKSTEGPQPEDIYGWVDKDLLTQSDLTKKDRQLLTTCTPVAKLEGTSCNNIGQYIKENGEAKQPMDMFDQTAYLAKGLQFDKKYKICHTYSNRSEAFLVATMKPYFHEYGSRMGLELDDVEGDGTDETLVLNQIGARPDTFDAFFVCMAKTTTALQYVQALAQKAYNYENNIIGTRKRTKYPSWAWNEKTSKEGWYNFEERLDTPLIFWIRHPTTDNGDIDSEILNNHYFKYTYYIGSDSKAGGSAQGELIKTAINKWYTDSVDK